MQIPTAHLKGTTRYLLLPKYKHPPMLNGPQPTSASKVFREACSVSRIFACPDSLCLFQVQMFLVLKPYRAYWYVQPIFIIALYLSNRYHPCLSTVSNHPSRSNTFTFCSRSGSLVQYSTQITHSFTSIHSQSVSSYIRNLFSTSFDPLSADLKVENSLSLFRLSMWFALHSY